MRTEINNIEDIKVLNVQAFLNKTDKVSLISDESVLSAIFYSISKVIQKSQKDLAIIESNLFPEFAYGEDLDLIAQRKGLVRYTTLGSSTYIRLVADRATSYLKNDISFTSDTGITFILESDIVEYISGDYTSGNRSYEEIYNFGYTYAKVQSVEEGSNTNVLERTITRINNQPQGHLFCINDYPAMGGRDIETDEQLKARIIDYPNILSTGTLSKITQIYASINPKVLSVKLGGLENSGKVCLRVSTQNGADLTEDEFSELLNIGDKYLSITEQKMSLGSSSGVVLRNFDVAYVDIDFRGFFSKDYIIDDVVRGMVLNISKYLDYRDWDYTKNVEWDNLLEIVKSTPGVEYIPDQYFSPKTDISIPKNKIPRIRGFVVRNINGVVISDSKNKIQPVYYPTYVDYDFINGVNLS